VAATAPPEARPDGRARRGALVTLLGLASAGVAVVAACTVAGFLARLWWRFELAAHFRVQYLVLLTVAGLALLAGRRRLFGFLALAFAALNLVFVAPLYVAARVFPPVSAAHAACRSGQLADLAAVCASAAKPLVVVGDLNMTPWSPYFGRLLREGGLRDGRAGHGLRPTWPAFFRPLLIPIDHCLVSGEVGVDGFETGPALRSDHRPIIVDLSVGGAE